MARYCYRDLGTGAYAGRARTMSTVGRAYVVRDADSGPGEVTQVYPYTLKGLTAALEDARFGSFRGVPQVVAVMRDGRSTVIRRFEHGREAPLAPLPPAAPGGGRALTSASPEVRGPRSVRKRDFKIFLLNGPLFHPITTGTRGAVRALRPGVTRRRSAHGAGRTAHAPRAGRPAGRRPGAWQERGSRSPGSRSGPPRGPAGPPV